MENHATHATQAEATDRQPAGRIILTDAEFLLKFKKLGGSQKNLAAELRVTPQSISKRLLKLGVTRRRKKTPVELPKGYFFEVLLDQQVKALSQIQDSLACIASEFKLLNGYLNNGNQMNPVE